MINNTNPTRSTSLPPVYSPPLLSNAERKQQQNNWIEAQIIKAICTVFNIRTNLVSAASFQATGKSALKLKSLNHICHPPFPAKIHFAPTEHGKGPPFTLNKLLTRPDKLRVIKTMLHAHLLDADDTPIILASFHPRVKTFISLTNLPLEPAPLCYSTLLRITQHTEEPTVDENFNHKWSTVKDFPVTIGNFRNILEAIKAQGLWQPEITAGGYTE
jgi:hypothetical protein